MRFEVGHDVFDGLSKFWSSWYCRAEKVVSDEQKRDADEQFRDMEV